MLMTSIIIGLIGVFCILDSRLLGRLNFERPLITCTLVGLALGDLQTGLAIGATLELMSLGLVHVGAASPVDMNMAAIITAAFAILTNATVEEAIALSVPIALLGQLIGMVVRILLANLTHVADNAIEKNDFKKARHMHILWGTICYSLSYFIPIFLAVYAGSVVVESIVEFIPGWLTDGLALSTKFLTAFGLSLLLSLMLKKELVPFFVLGFFVVAYLGIDITGIAIFAVILAVILSQLKFDNNNNNDNEQNDEFDVLEDDEGDVAVGQEFYT